MKRLVSVTRSSFLLVGVMTVLLGIVYPLCVTVIGQVVFHDAANGSLIKHGDKVVGSELLGQEFASPKYFWSRISATTPAYNPSASGGSNLGANNPKLMEAVNARVEALHKADPGNKNPIPVDLVTASASGLDPHISVAAAQYQVHRVAKARGIKEDEVKALVGKYTENPLFGLLSDPYVNVVQLNLALDAK